MTEIKDEEVVKSCPMTHNEKPCSGESCEWFVKTKRLSGRGLCAVTLNSLGAFMLEDIANNINRD